MRARAIALAAALALIAAAAALWIEHSQTSRQVRAGEPAVLRADPDHSRWRGDGLVLTRLWPTKSRPSHAFAGNFWASPVLVQLPQQAPFLAVLPSSGSVAALDLESGRLLWNRKLPHGPTEAPELRAAPAQVGDRLMVVYTTRDRASGAINHRAVMVDLRSGAIDANFPILTLTASARAAGDAGLIHFDPRWQLPRAAAYSPSADGLGAAYVTFSGDRDQGAWRGWLIKVDLERWRQGRLQDAISGFSTTREPECDDGSEGKLCGGGLWAYAGPSVRQTPAGDEIVIQSGNGRLDVHRDSYGQSMMRLRGDLSFAPNCDMKICNATNPRDPSPACLATCENLFVPRLMPGDAPLAPADGSCNGKTFLECLEVKDWDMGSTSPTEVTVSGRSFYVTGGKSGDVFLLDARRLGILYDHQRAIELCGTSSDPCPNPNEGMMMTQPVAVNVDGNPLVIMPTYNPDDSHSAGVVAFRVVVESGAPKLKLAWRAPDPKSEDARSWFRAPPTRPVVSMVAGEPIVWVANNGRDGRLLAIRARDGAILARARTGGWPMRNSKPVVWGNVVYLSAAVEGREDLSWVEAFKVSPGSTQPHGMGRDVIPARAHGR